MEKQLVLFDTPKIQRRIRKSNGQFCTMTQKEADERFHKVSSVMAENAMLKRKVESLNYLVNYYSHKSNINYGNERSKCNGSRAQGE